MNLKACRRRVRGNTSRNMASGVERDDEITGRVIHSGPDGIGDHRVKFLDPNYILATHGGIGSPAKFENASRVAYIFRVGKHEAFPGRDCLTSSDIGKGLTSPWLQRNLATGSLLKSGHQIKVGDEGPFRQANEERSANLRNLEWPSSPSLCTSNENSHVAVKSPKPQQGSLGQQTQVHASGGPKMSCLAHQQSISDTESYSSGKEQQTIPHSLTSSQASA